MVFLRMFTAFAGVLLSEQADKRKRHRCAEDRDFRWRCCARSDPYPVLVVQPPDHFEVRHRRVRRGKQRVAFRVDQCRAIEYQRPVVLNLDASQGVLDRTAVVLEPAAGDHAVTDHRYRASVMPGDVDPAVDPRPAGDENGVLPGRQLLARGAKTVRPRSSSGGLEQHRCIAGKVTPRCAGRGSGAPEHGTDAAAEGARGQSLQESPLAPRPPPGDVGPARTPGRSPQPRPPPG